MRHVSNMRIDHPSPNVERRVCACRWGVRRPQRQPVHSTRVLTVHLLATILQDAVLQSIEHSELPASFLFGPGVALFDPVSIPLPDQPHGLRVRHAVGVVLIPLLQLIQRWQWLVPASMAALKHERRVRSIGGEMQKVELARATTNWVERHSQCPYPVGILTVRLDLDLFTSLQDVEALDDGRIVVDLFRRGCNRYRLLRQAAAMRDLADED
jgi:hypothetical protein